MDVLLHLIGGVALMLWGVRMVRTGITRSYGAELRGVLARAGSRPIPAALAGTVATIFLQSSTATAVLISSFLNRGAIASTAALAAILGADVGTTLVVQLLSQRVDWLSPMFIATGVFAFLATERSRVRGAARAILGVGLVMLALTLIGDAARPLAQSTTFELIVGTLAGEGLLTFLLGAVTVLVMQSSVGAILLFAVLASHGVVSIGIGLALVFGANLGSACLPLLATLGSGGAVRRVLLTNLALRGIGALIAFLVAGRVIGWLPDFGFDPAQVLANAHTVFNVLVAIAGLAMLPLLDGLAVRFLPDRASSSIAPQLSHLDQEALQTPSIALACASREALRIGDVVKGMLKGTIQVLERNDAELRTEIERSDDEVDRLYEGTKLYLARLAREELDREEGDRSIEILTFTTNLEHIGDIIDKNLMELAGKKIKSRASFSEQGLEELRAFHSRVVANLDLAMNVFLTADVALARRLLQQKIEIRELERRSVEQHFVRIGEGRSVSIDSSALHLDILRDLKRINSHLTAIAYPILERTGELAATRLKVTEEAPATTGVPAKS